MMDILFCIFVGLLQLIYCFVQYSRNLLLNKIMFSFPYMFSDMFMYLLFNTLVLRGSIKIVLEKHYVDCRFIIIFFLYV